MAKRQKSNQAGSGENVNHQASPIEIQRYLKGMDYPAGKQDLVDCAMEEGADEKVLSSLEELPDQDYNSPADVMRAFGQTSGRQRSAG